MESVDQSNLITELLAQQDAVIEQLDGLIERIEAVLKSAVVSVGSEKSGNEVGAPLAPHALVSPAESGVLSAAKAA